MGIGITADPHFRRVQSISTLRGTALVLLPYFEPATVSGQTRNCFSDPRPVKDAIIGPAYLPVILQGERHAGLAPVVAKGRLPGAECPYPMPDVHFRAYPAEGFDIPSACVAASLRT